jgi:hypothetical protein
VWVCEMMKRKSFHVVYSIRVNISIAYQGGCVFNQILVRNCSEREEISNTRRFSKTMSSHIQVFSTHTYSHTHTNKIDEGDERGIYLFR